MILFLELSVNVILSVIITTIFIAMIICMTVLASCFGSLWVTKTAGRLKLQVRTCARAMIRARAIGILFVSLELASFPWIPRPFC